MTTAHHTPIARTANIDDTALNAPLAALDEQIGDMDDGTHNFSAIDIDGGAIDGVTIGANSAAALTANGLTASGNLTYGDAWLAHRNSSNQTIADSTITLIEFTNTDLDVNSNFDTVTNHDITPQVAGWYFLYLQVTFADVLAADKQILLGINSGFSTLQLASVSGGTLGGETFSVWTVAFANGSSTSFDARIFQGDTTSRDMSGSKARTFFAGWRMF